MSEKPKPKAWRPRKDAKCCIACGLAFKRGDKVYESCATNIHSHCVSIYKQQCKELGIAP